MPPSHNPTKRLSLAVAAAALSTACSPLSMFATLSPKDPASIGVRSELYGPNPRQKLDVYVPRRKAEGSPIAVFFYGGSWDSGRRQDYNWVGRALASRGYVTVVADYRVYPEVKYPVFLQDGAQAVRWAIDNAPRFGGDPSRIVLLGHSAGAYNAVMIGLDDRYLKDAGVDPRRIKALVGLAGPYDFLPLTDRVAIRTFGDSKDLDATQPTTYVSAASPPAFLATGVADNIVYPRNTTRLARKFRDAGATVEERHYPGVGHISIVLALSRPLRGQAPVLDEMTAFLREHVTD